MTDINTLALEGLDLIKTSMEKLGTRLIQDDLDLVKDLLDLQGKAIQISVGDKIPTAAMEELIARVNNRICSI